MAAIQNLCLTSNFVGDC